MNIDFAQLSWVGRLMVCLLMSGCFCLVLKLLLCLVKRVRKGGESHDETRRS